MIQKRRPRITVPSSAVGMLVSPGLDVPLINSSGALQSIDPNSPVTWIRFQHEFRDAPSMTMVSLGMATANLADPSLRLNQSMGFSPLETDFAMCDSQVVAGVQQSIPPDADGKWPSVELGEEITPLLGNLMLNRIKGDLAAISVTPTNGVGTTLANTLAVAVELRNLRVGLGLRNNGQGNDAPDGYYVNIASLSISCTAAIRHDVTFDLLDGPSPCGEQSVACLPGTITVNVTPPTTNLPPDAANAVLAAWNIVGTGVIHEIVQDGVVLHFEHFAASELGFTSGGTLQLRGTPTLRADGTSDCSPNALVPPQLPPSRALVQVQGRDGQGETRSTDGYVRKFTVRPYLSAQALDTGRNDAGILAADVRLQPDDAVTRKFGTQSLDFDASRVSARVRADRLDSTCWTRATTMNDIIKVFPLPAVGRLEGRFRKAGDLGKFGLREFRYTSLSRADPDEVAQALKSIGQSCNGSCSGYWRMDGVLGSNNYPTSWPMPPDGAPFDLGDVPPYLGQLWFHDDPTRQINDLFECKIAFHPIKDEVVLALPEVRLFDTLFDSARANSMGYAIRGNTAAASERTFTSHGVPNRMLVLQPDCWQRPWPACWSSELIGPDKYTVAAYGVSGTAIPRLKIRDAIDANNVASYGNGSAAPWGYFDRSQLDLYTAVPAEYAQAGVTTTGWDWRGHVRGDWEHDEAFPAPAETDRNGEKHASSGVKNWWRIDGTEPGEGDLIPYRPDFATDRILVRRRVATERTFCVSEEALTATVENVAFRRALHNTSDLVPASSIFQVQPKVVGTNSSVSGTLRAYAP